MRYQSTRPKRQFLAGVKCPKCDLLDVIVQVNIFEPKLDEYIECTECGHTEHRPSEESIRTKNEALNSKVTNAGIQIVSINS